MSEFIDKIAPIIIIENEKRGNPLFSSVVIAQAILETGWGKSQMMMKANAVFGIKAFNDWKGKVYSSITREVYNNNSINIEAKFRAYNSLEESISDYFDLICKSSRYRNALTSNTPKECIQAIKDGGYATDPEYVNKIMNIITSNNLTQYDTRETIDKYKTVYKIYKNYITKVDLNVRAGAGTNNRIKEYNELSEDGKKHAYNQKSAVLKKGTIVTVLDVIYENGNIWLKIPSGYIAGIYEGKAYVS